MKSSAVYHRRASRRRGDRIAGICSRRGNVISFARGKKSAATWPDPGPLSRPDRHDPRGAGLCRLHHAAIFGAAQAAGRNGRSQPQGFAATPAHPERFELAGAGHAGHARCQRALPPDRLDRAIRSHPQRSKRGAPAGRESGGGHAHQRSTALPDPVADAILGRLRPHVLAGAKWPGAGRARADSRYPAAAASGFEFRGFPPAGAKQ